MTTNGTSHATHVDQRKARPTKARLAPHQLAAIVEELRCGWRPDLPVLPFLRSKLPIIEKMQQHHDIAMADIAEALNQARIIYSTDRPWDARRLNKTLTKARKPLSRAIPIGAHWLRPALQGTRDPAADDNASARGEQRATTPASMPTIPEVGSISETQAPAPPKPTQPQPETETDLRPTHRAEDSDPRSWANPWTIPLPPIKFARKKVYPAIAADPPPVSAHDEAQPPGSSRPTRD